MDHEAYEAQMFDTINRHAGEVPTKEPIEVKPSSARIFIRGLKRTFIALLSVATLAISVLGFIAVATTPGYMAVVLFVASVITALNSFFLLFTQGIDPKERKGERK